MSIRPDSAFSVIHVTCAHCGHERNFPEQGITGLQLEVLDTHACNLCGKTGASVRLMAYHPPVPFELEALPPPR